jgi:restriction endonuclease Mrr
LALLADGQERHLRDVERALADQFRLTPEDREETASQ